MSSSVPFLKCFKDGFPFFSMEDKTQPILSIPQEQVEYKTGRKIKSMEKREGELHTSIRILKFFRLLITLFPFFLILAFNRHGQLFINHTTM